MKHNIDGSHTMISEQFHDMKQSGVCSGLTQYQNIYISNHISINKEIKI